MSSQSARYLGRIVAGQIGRVAFGNDAGLVNNLRGRAQLRAARKRSRGEVSGAAHVWRGAAEMYSHGWAALEPAVEPEVIEGIRQRCEDMLDDPAHSVDLGFAPRADAVRHIVDPLRKVPALECLLTKDAIETLRTVYCAEVAVENVRVWRTIHIPDEHLSVPARLRRRRAVSVMSNLMHCDTHPVSLTKFFVQLTPDCNAETGALSLLPISATKRAMRRGFVRPDVVVGPAREIVAGSDKLVVFDGPPGSGLLFNSELCLHAAGVPRSGASRLMVQFAMAPSAVPLPADWSKALRPDGEVLRRVR